MLINNLNEQIKDDQLEQLEEEKEAISVCSTHMKVRLGGGKFRSDEHISLTADEARFGRHENDLCIGGHKLRSAIL